MSKHHKKLSRAEAGRIGGKMTARRHGVEPYRAAGRKGFLATVARHWQGDAAGYVRWLRAHGWLRQIQEAFRASGATCIEIPLIPGLDDEEDTP